MPYKNVETRREYDRQYKRRKRAEKLKPYEREYAEGIGINPICEKLREQLRHATRKEAIFIEMLLEDNNC